MNNLVKANFIRLKKDKIFIICSVAIFLISVVMMLNSGRQGKQLRLEGYEYTLEGCFFNLVPMLSLFIAVFVSMFLGTEYSDGTVRNKIIVGHRRSEVYMSNLAVCFAGDTVIYAVWFLGSLAGLPFLGAWTFGAGTLLKYLAVGFLFTLSYTAIFTLLSHLSTNKAITAVSAIVIAFIILFAGSIIYNALSEPQMTAEMVLTENGVQTGEEYLNPSYIGGTLRTVLTAVMNMLPSGQAILMANIELAEPFVNMLMSVILIIVVTATGAAFFSKKDIK